MGSTVKTWLTNAFLVVALLYFAAQLLTILGPEPNEDPDDVDYAPDAYLDAVCPAVAVGPAVPPVPLAPADGTAVALPSVRNPARVDVPDATRTPFFGVESF